ncbi:LysM peptidoglycan-binding domain-containing protein [Halobacillus campisalis]|uniref:LysM peptidoglycan-binding domain-containing protein n=1 Tax=Halobacillus campisalis TaxID=435909 RepID=A0ABW2K8M5_9BACI|nr:LysM peptidoglycan-binding domain-containing protein [Halobacillus campisalis]
MNAKLLRLSVLFILLIAFTLPFSPQVEGASSQFVTKGNTSSKVVALTFDDGADGTNVENILQTLSSNNVKSTFFLTGSGTNHHPQKIKNIVSKGHEIGNHSYSHPDFTKLTAAQIKDELERTEDIIKSTTGRSTKPLFRAPFGAVNSSVLSAVGNAGYKHTIHWNIDTVDWKGNSAADIRNRVLNNIVPGSIVLMHTGAGASGTPGALPGIISNLKNQGYQFVTVSNLLNSGELSSTGTHTVKAGDTLYSLALKYNTSVSKIAAENQLDNVNFLRIGQVLKIPGESTAPPNSPATYTVKSGDTLYSIARKYNTTVSEITSVNQIRNAALIQVGQVLTIPNGSTSEPAAQTYTVKTGDTLYSIALRFGTTVQKIASANNISNPSFIRPGMKLSIS